MVESSLKRSRRDPCVFGDFYRDNVIDVTRYFARRVVDADAALDLASETFAQAYAGRRGFRGASDEEARAWLYVIAQRQLAGYLRRGYANREALARLGLERQEAGAEELQRVEELGGIGELRRRVARQMDELPGGCREAVRLRVVEELPYPEVAERLAISETAARMRVSRALKQLRGALGTEATQGGVA